MPFVAPLALLGLSFIPLVVAFYMLKLRREDAVVPSTLLWQRLLADVEANAPWQRLRRSLLLLLQLLLVAILAILAARPFLERPAGLAGDLVVVIDTSASMGATDVAPNRLEAAKAAVLDSLRDLPGGGRVSVIAAAGSARVVANGTTDLGRVRQAIASLTVSNAPGDLADGLRLASALAARASDAEVLVATDAALAGTPDARVDAPVRVLRVGRDAKNQAIVAVAVRTAPSAVTRSVFVSVANLDLESAQRRVELWGDGILLEARDLFLDAQSRADVSIDDVPRDVGVVEVRLVAGGGAVSGGGSGPATAPDRLAADDRAWAIVPRIGCAGSSWSATATRISRRPWPTCRRASCTRSRRPSTARPPTRSCSTWSSSRAPCPPSCPTRRCWPSRPPRRARSERSPAASRNRVSARPIPMSRSSAMSTCRPCTSPRRAG